MGLTIHYGLDSRTRTAERAKALVERMRQLALDLPFEHVDDKVHYLGPKICQRPLESLRGNDRAFSAVLEGSISVDVPWHRKQGARVRVQPLEIFSFDTIPGPGSEWATFGLARFPAEIETDYTPHDDDRFISTITKDGMTRWEFNWRKFHKWQEEQIRAGNSGPHLSEFHEEKRKIKTRLSSGWRYSAFCKTQYASEPAAGGVPNFIRCHLCVIHLLDRIAELPTMKVSVDDEGKYGRSYYTDDPWAEKRVYTWHEGKYSVKALAEEVGEWNTMIAAAFGGLQDMAKAHGQEIDAPIASYSDFERLEFKGQQLEYLAPFLDAMKQLAEKQQVQSE